MPVSLCVHASVGDSWQIAAKDNDPRESLPSSEELANAGLTPEEIELLPLLSASTSLAEISQVLGLERSVVESRARSIYRKLDLPPTRDVT